jgi:uncharacterized NAD(P)/FAD-binding protein YdhS
MIEVDAAIVGGGFSGCAVAANLSRHAPIGFSLAIFEPGEIGRGAAYGTRHPEHLLNTRAHQMSLYSDEPNHFVAWLGPRGGPADFVSRRLYGDYVGDVAARALARSRFMHIGDRVAAINASGEAFVVETSLGARFRARAVVLAVGNALPSDEFLPLESRLHPGYVADPWRFDHRHVGGHVLVIGSGLTALDVLVALKACGHRGTVHVLSRHGRFPEVHANVTPFDVIPALDAHAASVLLRSVRRHLEGAAERGFDWRAVVDAIRPEAEAIWRRLPPIEQERFERHLRSHWDRRRHRAPQQVDAVRAEYVRTGRLHTHAGRLLKMESGTATIALRDVGIMALRPDWIFNCSGIGRVAALKRDPLLASLFASGAISPDRRKLGLQVSPELNAVDAAGKCTPRLWILGSAVRGSRFEATAVPELRLMAESVASKISSEFRSQALVMEATQ